MKIISKKNIFKADLFDVFELEIQNDSGRSTIHHNVVRKKAVTIVPLDKNNEVVLIKQFRYLHGKKIIEAIAGFVEEGEDDLAAAKRELKEEAGITAAKLTLMVNTKAAGSVVGWDQPIFLATDLEFGKAVPEEDEDIELLKMGIDEAVNLIISGELQTSSSIIGILMLDKLMKEGKI